MKWDTTGRPGGCQGPFFAVNDGEACRLNNSGAAEALDAGYHFRKMLAVKDLR